MFCSKKIYTSIIHHFLIAACRATAAILSQALLAQLFLETPLSSRLSNSINIIIIIIVNINCDCVEPINYLASLLTHTEVRVVVDALDAVCALANRTPITSSCSFSLIIRLSTDAVGRTALVKAHAEASLVALTRHQSVRVRVRALHAIANLIGDTLYSHVGLY